MGPEDALAMDGPLALTLCGAALRRSAARPESGAGSKGGWQSNPDGSRTMSVGSMADLVNVMKANGGKI